MPSVLFVCLGNICRSPAAEGMLRRLSDEQGIDLEIQSCGMGDWHVGQLPDERMRAASKARGVVLASRAQQFKPEFLDQFDYILAADKEVLYDLHRFARTAEQKAKIHLITEFSSSYHRREVPDPYYEGDATFELVLDILEDACQGLLIHLQNHSASDDTSSLSHPL